MFPCKRYVLAGEPLNISFLHGLWLQAIFIRPIMRVMHYEYTDLSESNTNDDFVLKT